MECGLDKGKCRWRLSRLPYHYGTPCKHMSGRPCDQADLQNEQRESVNSLFFSRCCRNSKISFPSALPSQFPSRTSRSANRLPLRTDHIISEVTGRRMTGPKGVKRVPSADSNVARSSPRPPSTVEPLPSLDFAFQNLYILLGSSQASRSCRGPYSLSQAGCKRKLICQCAHRDHAGRLRNPRWGRRQEQEAEHGRSEAAAIERAQFATERRSGPTAGQGCRSQHVVSLLAMTVRCESPFRDFDQFIERDANHAPIVFQIDQLLQQYKGLYGSVRLGSGRLPRLQIDIRD